MQTFYKIVQHSIIHMLYNWDQENGSHFFCSEKFTIFILSIAYFGKLITFLSVYIIISIFTWFSNINTNNILLFLHKYKDMQQYLHDKMNTVFWATKSENVVWSYSVSLTSQWLFLNNLNLNWPVFKESMWFHIN
jgi:hypothetical protein